MVALEQLSGIREKYGRLKLLVKWQEDIYAAPSADAVEKLLVTLRERQDPLFSQFGYLAHRDQYGHPAKRDADVYEEIINLAERRKRSLSFIAGRALASEGGSAN